MHFIIGSVCISLSILIFSIVLLGARNPRQPGWASAQWVANCHSVVILMLGVIGLFALTSAIYSYATTGAGDPMSILISAAILAGAILGIKAMKIKKRLAEFESLSKHWMLSKKAAGSPCRRLRCLTRWVLPQARSVRPLGFERTDEQIDYRLLARFRQFAGACSHEGDMLHFGQVLHPLAIFP